MIRQTKLPLADILPLTAAVNEAGHLTLGGCDAVELAREFGTPLYVFDEETLRERCREFQSQFRARYPDTVVAYAAKAYLGRALAAIVAEEGMALDVVSGGELAIAASVGFPPERIYFHGNNKLGVRAEGGAGLRRRPRRHRQLPRDAPAERPRPGRAAYRQPVLLRLSPGVDPHTHAHTTTGTLDSKFGIPLPTGQAEAAVRQALEMPGLEREGAARAPGLAGVRAGAVQGGGGRDAAVRGGDGEEARPEAGGVQPGRRLRRPVRRGQAAAVRGRVRGGDYRRRDGGLPRGTACRCRS